MAVRNWWIEVEIDGRKTKLQGGPQAKDGGFTLTVRQRDNGASVPVLTVRGIAFDDGRLQLVTVGERGQNDAGVAYLDDSFTHTTER